MIVNDADRLKKGINDHRTHELKPSLLQVLADPLRELSSARNLFIAIPAIDDRFIIHIVPQKVRKASEFLLDIKDYRRIVSDCPEL